MDTYSLSFLQATPLLFPILPGRLRHMLSGGNLKNLKNLANLDPFKTLSAQHEQAHELIQLCT